MNTKKFVKKASLKGDVEQMIKGQTTIETQDLIDLALELENYKDECNRLALLLKDIQMLIDRAEDEAYDRIKADDESYYIVYPRVDSEALADLLDIDIESRKERWLKVAKKRLEFLKENHECTE